MSDARRHRREARHCCAACAASIPRQRRRVGSRPTWTWVTLLGVTAALIPLAASEGGAGPAVAQAAEAPAPAPPTPIASVAAAPRQAVRVERPPRPAVEWHDSLALGTPNAGALEGGVRLPSEGTGYYTYNPATQRPPGGDDRTWGTATLVHHVLDLGRWWARTHPAQPLLGVGDLAREHGGPFSGPVVGHQSHQNGLDVDIRLVRSDGAEAAVDPASYDRALTQALVDRLVEQGASLILIGPSLDLHGPAGVVVRWPAHDDHLHVRFPDPDGTGN